MVRTEWRWQSGAALIGVAVALAVAPAEGKSRSAQPSFRASFAVDKANLVDHGRTPYFVLEPGYKLHFEHADEKLVITVLNETRVVDGVKTRVVEEHETKAGRLVEISRNFFAINKGTGDVYYFGEEVDIYKNGKLTGHEGAWLSGVNGARFGLMIPGKPVVGDRYHNEVAPKVALDRAQIVSVNETLRTPAGTFKNCVRARESTVMEPGTSDKVYGRNVGLVKDGDMVLVRVEQPKP